MTADQDPAAAEESSEPTVVVSVDGGVATLRFNRPKARNALDPQSMELLRTALADAATDDAVRVVVLTGTGDTFSAGADLKAALVGGFDSGPRVMAELLAAIQDHPKPTIARVQGNVYGGGNGLVAACDLAVAVDHARFAFSEVRLGLTPAVISTVCLPKLHPADAAELFLTGERVPAERVARAGMINAVVPAEGLDGAVAGWVDQLRRGGPEALAGTKQLLRRVPELSRDDGFAWTAEYSLQFFQSAEAMEGMSALLQKRPASWCAD